MDVVGEARVEEEHTGDQERWRARTHCGDQGCAKRRRRSEERPWRHIQSQMF